jgi:hypothetical protein
VSQRMEKVSSHGRFYEYSVAMVLIGILGICHGYFRTSLGNFRCLPRLVPLTESWILLMNADCDFEANKSQFWSFKRVWVPRYVRGNLEISQERVGFPYNVLRDPYKPLIRTMLWEPHARDWETHNFVRGRSHIEGSVIWWDFPQEH